MWVNTLSAGSDRKELTQTEAPREREVLATQVASATMCVSLNCQSLSVVFTVLRTVIFMMSPGTSPVQSSVYK